MAIAVAGGTYTPFNAANANIGVGDGSSVFDPVQTDLQGANLYRQSVDSASQNNNTLSFTATFGTGVANFAWNEWGVFNANANGVMLTRKLEAVGTKTNSQSWQYSVTITINAT